jgi:hypothetical protein
MADGTVTPEVSAPVAPRPVVEAQAPAGQSPATPAEGSKPAGDRQVQPKEDQKNSKQGENENPTKPEATDRIGNPDESQELVDDDPRQTIDSAVLAAQIHPEAGQTMIELVASGNKIVKVIETRTNQMKQEAVDLEKGEVKSPAKLALALDLEIEGLQYQLDEYEFAAKRSRKGTLSEAQRAKVKELLERKKQLQEQRNSGKIKFKKADGSEIQLENDQIKNEPNQVEIFAQKMGIDPEQAKGHPLYAIRQQIEGAVVDKNFRTAFLKHLSENKVFSQEENENKAAVAKIKEFVDKASQIRSIKEKGKIAAKGAGLVGLLMMLMMWQASKEKKQGAMG